MNEITEDMMKAVEDSVKMIALSRRIVELKGDSIEDFDKDLNAMCEKWHKKFEDMNFADISHFMLDELINSAIERKEKE